HLENFGHPKLIRISICNELVIVNETLVAIRIEPVMRYKNVIPDIGDVEQYMAIYAVHPTIGYNLVLTIPYIMGYHPISRSCKKYALFSVKNNPAGPTFHHVCSDPTVQKRTVSAVK